MVLAALVGLSGPALAQDVVKAVPAGRDQVQLSFAPLVKQVAPAVVNIYTTRMITRRAVNPLMDDPFFRQFFGVIPEGGAVDRKKVQGALGSGVIIDDAGLVVTNAHVIKGADEVKVVLADGREFEARVSLMDEPSDLALLRIEPHGEKLPFARLRSTEGLEVGDMVIAIGNPFGVGQTVTSGIVSALARSSLNISDFNFFIQTDAAINPGNSGGPLIAMDGGVVGINSAIYSQSGGSMGLGFAIPSEMVESVIAAENVDGDHQGVVRPWLGIAALKVSSDIAESLGLDKPAGVLVKGLHNSSPLKKAGVQVGDVILRMNGHDLRDPSEMKFRMATVRLGDNADISVSRQGKLIDFKIKAIAPPDEPDRQQTMLDTGLFAGVTVANINPAVATELGLDDLDQKGVIITAIDRTAAARRVMRPGDMIVSVNGVDIKTVAHIKKALMLRVAGWNVVIDRGGQRQQIVIR